MKKMVLSLDVHDDAKCKQKVMKIASSFQGVDDISLDAKENKLTLIGTMDMVEVVNKLRKVYRTTVVSIGPPKEPEKPNEKGHKEPEPPPYIVYVHPWPWHYY